MMQEIIDVAINTTGRANMLEPVFSFDNTALLHTISAPLIWTGRRVVLIYTSLSSWLTKTVDIASRELGAIIILQLLHPKIRCVCSLVALIGAMCLSSKSQTVSHRIFRPFLFSKSIDYIRDFTIAFAKADIHTLNRCTYSTALAFVYIVFGLTIESWWEPLQSVGNNEPASIQHD